MVNHVDIWDTLGWLKVSEHTALRTLHGTYFMLIQDTIVDTIALLLRFLCGDLQPVQMLARLLSLSAAENLGCYHYGFAFTTLRLRNSRWELLNRLTRKMSIYAFEQGATLAQGCCRAKNCFLLWITHWKPQAFRCLSWNTVICWLPLARFTWRQEPVDEYYRESFPKAHGL